MKCETPAPKRPAFSFTGNIDPRSNGAICRAAKNALCTRSKIQF